MPSKEEMVGIFRQAITTRIGRVEKALNDLKVYADEEWDDTEGIRRAVGDIDVILPDICRYTSKLEDAIYEAEQVKV